MFNIMIVIFQYFVNYKLGGEGEEIAFYRKYFLSTLGFVAQVPNVLLNGLNVFCQCKGLVLTFLI